MSAKALDTILSVLVRQAVSVWETEGVVTGVCWLAGDGRAVFSVPGTAEAYTDDDEVVLVQATLANHYDSQYMGSIDEVFAKECNVTDDAPGDLATLAETDPTVSTALCVEGLCRKTGETIMHMAILKLTDEGEPTWDVVVLNAREHRGAQRALRAHDLASQIGGPLEPDELREFLDAQGWAASVADDNVWSLLC